MDRDRLFLTEEKVIIFLFWGQEQASDVRLLQIIF